MKKQEVIAAVAEATGYPKSQVENTLDQFTTLLHAQMSDGGEWYYPNLGKFFVATQAARTARNPHTGEQIQVDEKQVVKFKMAKPLKESAAS